MTAWRNMKKKKQKKIKKLKSAGMHKSSKRNTRQASQKKSKTPFKSQIMQGRIDGTSRGYAFFVPDDGTGDIFIPASKLYGAIHGDIVEVIKTSEHKGAGEGEVYRVISRTTLLSWARRKTDTLFPTLAVCPLK